jgi:antitoxin (DNA-binding transcriptional repressor) of toxin-antitoxin stability system
MKNIVGLKEFRKNVDVWIKHVKHGNTVVVLKRSEPVFKISPVSEDFWEEVIDFTKIKKGGVNIKQLLTRL